MDENTSILVQFILRNCFRIHSFSHKQNSRREDLFSDLYFKPSREEVEERKRIDAEERKRKEHFLRQYLKHLRMNVEEHKEAEGEGLRANANELPARTNSNYPEARHESKKYPSLEPLFKLCSSPSYRFRLPEHPKRFLRITKKN